MAGNLPSFLLKYKLGQKFAVSWLTLALGFCRPLSKSKLVKQKQKLVSG
jgi:hypothetical protein